MLSYQESLAIVEKQLTQFVKERKPAELYQPIEYILSIGGKRIRPCLSLMAYSMFSDHIDPVLDPAIGIEVFHNFTLMHDDIMDNATRRRNFETVHVKWNDNVAILSGDAMLILAYQLMCHAPDGVLPQVLKLYNKTALEVCEGQQYDMNFEVREQVSVEEYLNMIRLKTAVLIAASLALGGLIAGTTADNCDALYQFGLNTGMGFQLQDDYLDVFAEGEKFGKSIGNDILSNKKTFLLLSALQSGDKKIVESLKSWISKKEFSPSEKIAAVKDIYIQLRLGESSLQLAQNYFDRGLSYLQKVQASSEKKEELIQLVKLLIKRKH